MPRTRTLGSASRGIQSLPSPPPGRPFPNPSSVSRRARVVYCKAVQSDPTFDMQPTPRLQRIAACFGPSCLPSSDTFPRTASTRHAQAYPDVPSETPTSNNPPPFFSVPAPVVPRPLSRELAACPPCRIGRGQLKPRSRPWQGLGCYRNGETSESPLMVARGLSLRPGVTTHDPEH